MLDATETLEVPESSENISAPKELSFEMDYSKYPEVDFFDEYYEKIPELDELSKTNINEYKRKLASTINEIFDKYFKENLQKNGEVFVNAVIKRKECIPIIFSNLMEKSFSQLGINYQESKVDLETLFSESVGNFPRHAQTDLEKDEKIPFKLLITKNNIQFLVGRTDLEDIPQEEMNKLCAIPNLLNMDLNNLNFDTNEFAKNLSNDNVKSVSEMRMEEVF
jgi:hypothetical protein